MRVSIITATYNSVSTIAATYNRASPIKDTLHNIKDQSYSDIEQRTIKNDSEENNL